jgi:hypothetical protein
VIVLAPDLALALETSELFVNGQGQAEAVITALGPVLIVARESVQLFKLVSPGLLRNETVNELLRQISLEQKAQIDGCEQLLKAARAGRAVGQKGALRSLRSACERLPGLFAQLQQEEVKAGSSSAFPILDTLIKTSWNCLHGEVAAELLKLRLDAAVSLLAGLRLDVDRFRRLIGRPELVKATREPFKLLEAGIGAGFSYLRSRRTNELEDSLRLLLQASPQLQSSLDAVDKAAKDEARYSQRRYLEELGRVCALPREQQNGLYDPAWARLTQVEIHVERELAVLSTSPIHFEITAQIDSCASLLEAASEAARSGQAARAIAAFEALEQSYDELRARVQEGLSRYKNAPHLGELRDVVGRTLLGQVSPEDFSAVLDEARERQQHFLEQLGAGAANREIAELGQLVQSHGPALDMMANYLQGENTFFLLAGWRQIEATVPRLQQLNQILRRS